MDEGGAVQQLHRGSGGVGDRGLVIAACLGHGKAEGRPDPGPARKNSVPHGFCQTGRCQVPLRPRQKAFESGFDSQGHAHSVSLPRWSRSLRHMSINVDT